MGEAAGARLSSPHAGDAGSLPRRRGPPLCGERALAGCRTREGGSARPCAASPARQAEVSLRFGPVTLKRPRSSPRHLPPGVTLTLVEVVETPAPGTAEPVHWRLLTTHDVTDASTAWRIVE